MLTRLEPRVQCSRCGKTTSTVQNQRPSSFHQVTNSGGLLLVHPQTRKIAPNVAGIPLAVGSPPSRKAMAVTAFYIGFVQPLGCTTHRLRQTPRRTASRLAQQLAGPKCSRSSTMASTAQSRPPSNFRLVMSCAGLPQPTRRPVLNAAATRSSVVSSPSRKAIATAFCTGFVRPSGSTPNRLRQASRRSVSRTQKRMAGAKPLEPTSSKPSRRACPTVSTSAVRIPRAP